MFHLTSRTLLALSLLLTTTSVLSIPPANSQPAGDKKVDAGGGTAGSAGSAGTATASGAADKTAKGQSSATATGDDAQTKGKKRKHHGKTADSGEQPKSDKWNSFHKPHTDVGGHNNTDSGFDFQHANEKL